MIIDFHNRGGGGGTTDYATSAGTSNSTKLLQGEANFPQSANTGDVVAVAPAPTRGLRSANTTLGVYQFDGTDWNKIEGGEGGSEPYKIELSSVDPSNYTTGDTATLDAFFAAYSADTSIADSAYIYAVNGIYRCVKYTVTPNFSIFTFEGTYNNNIVDLWLGFVNGSYSSGNMQNAVPTPPAPDFTTLEAVSELPASGETGDVIALSIPAQEGTWEVFDASASPTTVRILTKNDGTYLLHFDSDNLYTGLDYTAGTPTFSGEGWGLYQDDTYNWHYDDNGYYINVWVEEQDGDWYIYAEMTQGEGGFSTLDAYGLGSTTEMLIGHIDGHIGIYQYDGSAWNEIGGGGSSGFEFSEKFASVGEFIEGNGEGTPIGLVAVTDPVEGFYNALELSTDGFPEARLKVYAVDNSDPSDPQISEDISIRIATEDDLEGLPQYDQDLKDIGGGSFIKDNGTNFDPENPIYGDWNIGIARQTSELGWNVLGIDGDGEAYIQPLSIENSGMGESPELIAGDMVPLVGSSDAGYGYIKRIVKISQSDYDNLVNNDEVDENTFYIVVADPSQPIGVWSDDGNGTYTFQILDTDPALWSNDVLIGELSGINWPHASNDPINMDVYLQYNGSWEISTHYADGAVSDEPHYDFTDGMIDEWVTGLRTSDASSESNITVSWDGTDTFTFYSADSDYPLSMNTIDPA